MKILLGLLLLSFNLKAQQLETIGVVDSIKKNEITIRTPREDLVLNLKKLSQETQAQLNSPDAKKNKLTIKYDQSAVIKRTNTPMGVRADCSELPTNMDELGDIAKSSTDMLDFLNKIPEGSLQGFTFVTNSLSLHRGVKDANGEGQVSPMWPRVLRTSMDGKITVSFVCDPKNPTFGKVEIIHFDDKEKEFRTTEFDFGHPSGKKVAPQDRIHKDPVSCISCHAGSEFNGKPSLKPNWPEYFQWSDCQDDRGIQVYGGNDDNMEPGALRAVGTNGKFKGCDNLKSSEATYKEQKNYKKFRDLQKNNACFNSLPWPDKSKDPGSFFGKWTYDYYPYAKRSAERVYDPKNPLDDTGLLNYSLRTNFRLTDTYSHLMSQRIAGLLKKSPDYDAIKYLLVMEQTECSIPDDMLRDIASVMPGFDFNMELQHNSNLDYTPILARFSKHAGLKPVDWTMEFQEKKNSDYNSAMPNDEGMGGDLKIQDVVGGEILKDIAQTNKVFANAPKDALTRGVTRAFGEKFSCIDDLGGRVIPSPKSKEFKGKMCELLKKESEKNIKAIKERQAACHDCKKLETPALNTKLSTAVDNVVVKINNDQIARGKKLVEADSKGKCVTCHSASVDMLPKDFRFIPSEKDKNKAESVAILKARRDEIAKKIEHRLIKTKTMPPTDNNLTDQDREDIKAYLLSVAAGK